MVLTSIVVVAVSPQARQNLRMLLYILGFGFAKLVVLPSPLILLTVDSQSHLQIAHISASRFRQFRFSLFLVFTLLLLNSITSGLLSKPLFEEQLLLLSLLAVVLIGTLLLNRGKGLAVWR